MKPGIWFRQVRTFQLNSRMRNYFLSFCALLSLSFVFFAGEKKVDSSISISNSVIYSSIFSFFHYDGSLKNVAKIKQKKSETLTKEKINLIAQKIASIHNFILKGDVNFKILKRKKLMDRIKSIVFLDYSKLEILDEGRMMIRLGLYPAGADYEKTNFSLLEEQVLGLYDIEEHELLLLDAMPEIMAETTLFHEIVHAVQDQNYDLKNLMKREKGAGDRKLALTSVMEGDAMIVEELIGGGGFPQELSGKELENIMANAGSVWSKIRKVPPVSRKTLLFPYSYGYSFMKRAFIEGGIENLNRIMQNPPCSTEQVIHWESYINRDNPENVIFTLPENLKKFYRIAMEDVMGEFSIKTWLGEFVDEEMSDKASDGWKGDWFVFLWPEDEKLPQRGIFVLLTQWDGKGGDSKDSFQFFSALQKMVEKRWKPSKFSNGKEFKIYKNYLGEWIVILRNMEKVLYIEGLPANFFNNPFSLAKEILVSSLKQ